MSSSLYTRHRAFLNDNEQKEKEERLNANYSLLLNIQVATQVINKSTKREFCTKGQRFLGVSLICLTQTAEASY